MKYKEIVTISLNEKICKSGEPFGLAEFKAFYGPQQWKY